MAELDHGYVCETRIYDDDRWYEILGLFNDSNIYQTWSYDAKRYGPKNINHIILTYDRKIVAAAQTRIMRIPLLHAGIAYIRWGPLWNIRGEQRNPGNFRQVVRALKNEYVLRQGLMLRLFPVLFQDEDEDLRTVLYEEGYVEQLQRARGRTILLNICAPLEDLRKNLDQKWRNCLNHAERNQLEVVEGESDEHFNMFKELYRELLKRKKFDQPNDINEFQAIQNDLPEGWKMRIFLCRSGEELGAGAICSAIGDKGVYLFGATNDRGMANKGSYLIQWRIIQWLKNAGYYWYDLNGVNPIRNPGTYRFKTGIAGKKGRDVQFIGQYDCYSTALGRLLSSQGDRLFSRIRQFKRLVKKIFGRI